MATKQRGKVKKRQPINTDRMVKVEPLTENQKRMFQQTKRIPTNCTNRKPENVIQSVLLRVQARLIGGKLSKIFREASG